MCSGPILGKMLLFAMPLMCSSILQLLFNAADILVVGRFAGDNSLAAVGSNTALINLLPCQYAAQKSSFFFQLYSCSCRCSCDKERRSKVKQRIKEKSRYYQQTGCRVPYREPEEEQCQCYGKDKIFNNEK